MAWFSWDKAKWENILKMLMYFLPLLERLIPSNDSAKLRLPKAYRSCAEKPPIQYLSKWQIFDNFSLAIEGVSNPAPGAAKQPLTEVDAREVTFDRKPWFGRIVELSENLTYVSAQPLTHLVAMGLIEKQLEEQPKPRNLTNLAASFWNWIRGAKPCVPVLDGTERPVRFSSVKLDKSLGDLTFKALETFPQEHIPTKIEQPAGESASQSPSQVNEDIAKTFWAVAVRNFFGFSLEKIKEIRFANDANSKVVSVDLHTKVYSYYDAVESALDKRNEAIKTCNEQLIECLKNAQTSPEPAPTWGTTLKQWWPKISFRKAAPTPSAAGQSTNGSKIMLNISITSNFTFAIDPSNEPHIIQLLQGFQQALKKAQDELNLAFIRLLLADCTWELFNAIVIHGSLELINHAFPPPQPITTMPSFGVSERFEISQALKRRSSVVLAGKDESSDKDSFVTCPIYSNSDKDSDDKASSDAKIDNKHSCFSIFSWFRA